MRVVSFRRRLADFDAFGIAVKHLTDGIVDYGLLDDDSAKHIASVEHEQVRVARAEDERVVLVLTRTA